MSVLVDDLPGLFVDFVVAVVTDEVQLVNSGASCL